MWVNRKEKKKTTEIGKNVTMWVWGQSVAKKSRGVRNNGNPKEKLINLNTPHIMMIPHHINKMFARSSPMSRSEVVARRCFLKKVFLKNLRNSHVLTYKSYHIAI